MTTLEWIATGLLVALLLALLPIGWRLERRIATLRREGSGLADGAESLVQATGAAETALARLRATAEGAGRAVAERIAVAEKLRDDLAFLVERAETLADRLDGLVRDARPLAAEAPATPSAPTGPAAPAVPAAGGSAVAALSQAERELLRALKGLR
jgi:cell division septum initiation protein DivIVA